MNPSLVLAPRPSFFSNSFVLAKALNASLFGEVGVDHLTIDRSQCLLSVHLKHSRSLPELLGVNTLGQRSVKCRLPRRFVFSYGVVGPLGDDTTDEEVTDELRRSGHEDAVASRIMLDKTKRAMFRIAFASRELPATVRFLGGWAENTLENS